MSASTSTFASGFDFDAHKYESSLDSTTTYMDNGLDYFRYPPSPRGSVNPSMLTSDSGSNMDLNTLNSMHDFAAYSSAFDLSPRPFTPPEPTLSDMGSISPQTVFYSLAPAAELTDGFMPPAMMSAPQPQAPSVRAGRSRSPNYGPQAAAPRATARFNPMAIPASRATGRVQAAATTRRRAAKRQSDDFDSDDEEDEEFHPAGNAESIDSLPLDAAARREAVRRQRIESEQRRRDELREGYAKLKDVLPHTNQKISKVSILDRATTRIKELEALNMAIELKYHEKEEEAKRNRVMCETLMLRVHQASTMV
jgi:hypothetical protein